MNTALNDEFDEDIEFIRLPEVMKLTGFRTTKIYEMVKKGDFPKQINLGGHAVAWIKSEVIQWCRDQIAQARGKQA